MHTTIGVRFATIYFKTMDPGDSQKRERERVRERGRGTERDRDERGKNIKKKDHLSGVYECIYNIKYRYP